MGFDMRVPVYLRVLIGLLCITLIAPILIVMALSISGDTFLTFPPRSLSLQWYTRFFSDARWQSALYTSVAIGLGACLIATSVGFLAAYALVRGRFRNKKLMLAFVLLPLIIPNVITAIALYFLSAPLGLVGSKPWISITHAVVGMPIVVLILLSTLQSIDINVERAAFGMGASRFTTFRRVILPLALPGVVSAALFSFLTSFDELIIALFLSGISSETLQVRIWNSLTMDAEPIIAAVSGFLIIVTVALLLFETLMSQVKKRRLGS